MKMPASFAEFSDALQKARIKDGSFCKNELTCIHYNGLTHAMIGWNANLYDLNLFAQRLASLTEEQKKGMDALLKIKQNHRVAPIPLNQLINLTYNTDICCFAPRVSNHEELGAFLYANEMLSNEAMALLDTTEEGSGFQERLLELLGEQHQEDHGGVFTDFGYAELGGEIKDIYVCQSNETACFHRSDAPVMLEVRKGFFNDPSYGDGRSALKPEASQMVLKRWGFKRTNFVLANTIERLGPYKEQLSAENQEWQKKAYVPPDDAHNRYFEVDTALAYLDAFISQVREAYGKLELFGPEHCEPNSYESLDYEGRVLVLSPDTLKESCWTPQNQLWLAHDGFGCSPHAVGRSIRCTCLGDGEQTRWNRTDFTGVLKEEFLPGWAREKLEEFQGQNAGMGGMEMT